jgi:hypothetical protein
VFDLPEVAGAQPALVVEHRAGLVGAVAAAGHHLGAADPELADLAGSALLPGVGVDDALASERGVAGLTLAEVGRAAGVSRQAVYLNFDNRAGLLLAMARRADEASGFVARIAATRELPARERFVATLDAWLAHLPTILPVARALEAATITGD